MGGGTTDRIERRIDLKAPVSKVWRALTDHASFGAWFGCRLDGPFVVGETVHGRVTHPGYEHLPFDAKVVALEPERYFAFRWPHEATGLDVEKDPTTLVEFRLEPIATGTRLTIVESGFEALPAHVREAAFRGNEGGWTQQLQNIERHVDAS